MYPYLSDENGSEFFWTGFYSSRPNIKRYARMISQLMLNSMKLMTPELLYL